MPHLHYLLFPLCLSLQALLHFLQNFSFIFLLLKLEKTGYFMKASYEQKSLPSLLHFVIRECDKLLLTQNKIGLHVLLDTISIRALTLLSFPQGLLLYSTAFIRSARPHSRILPHHPPPQMSHHQEELEGRGLPVHHGRQTHPSS